MIETTRFIMNMMLETIAGSLGHTRWGIAIVHRPAVSGGPAGGYYSLYVPYGDIIESYLPCLGNVSAGRGCIRFSNLQDVDTEQLRLMFAAISRKAGAQAVHH